MQRRFSKNIGRRLRDGATFGRFRRRLNRRGYPPTGKRSGALTLSAAATHARQTALPAGRMEAKQRALAVSSSGLLMHFARELWSEKIHEQGQMRLGLGFDFDANWNALATLCCPPDCGPVALGLTANGTACSCSPNWYSPMASDGKGGTAKQRTDGGNRKVYRNEWTRKTGFTYPDPEVSEALLGFPVGWTDLEASETQSTPTLPNGSVNDSWKEQQTIEKQLS